MASHFDLEEQEQLDQLKHFWSKYGNLITWVLIVVMAGLASWNGWQYWQRKMAVEAAALYDELDMAAQTKDLEKLGRVWTDMQQRAGNTVQAQQGALLVAKLQYEGGQAAPAREALQWVVNGAKNDGLVAVARLRLAALEFQDKKHEAALKWLDATFPGEFQPLADDRRGDVLLAKGDSEGARQAYRQSYAGLKETDDFRRIVEAKLNALGVDPTADAKP